VFSGLGVLYILFNLKMGNQGILPILIGVSISSIFVSLMEPAYRATVSDLLTQEEYGKASGMVQMAGNAKYLISPALAGLLLHISDISLILALDFGTFIITVSSIFIARSHMQKPMKKETKSSLKKEFQEGFQVVSKNKEIRSLIMIMTLVCFFLGFIQTLTAPMILAVSDAKTVGYIESFCAAGMLVSSIFIGIFGIKNNGYRKILMISAVLCGLIYGIGWCENQSILCFTYAIYVFF